MAERDDLLSAVINDPDDAALRLAFSDWLEDHGEAERAELIRVQMERQTLPESDERQVALEARELSLLAEHYFYWTPNLPVFSRACFRRGFIEHIEAPADVLLEQMEEAFQRQPIRSVMITDLCEEGVGRELAQRPEWSRVEAIGIGDSQQAYRGTIDDSPGFHGTPDYAALLQSRHLSRLQALYLKSRVPRGMSDMIGTSNTFSQLRELHIEDGGDLSPTLLLNRLAGVPHLPLSTLCLYGHPGGSSGLGREGMEALINGPHWKRLEHLTIGIDDESPGIGPYIQKSKLQSLRVYEAWRDGRSECTTFFESLVDAESWGRLRSLHFQDFPIGQYGLFSAKQLRQIESLKLHGERTEAEVCALLANPHSCNLRHLELPNRARGNNVVEAFLKGDHLANLLSLRLCQSNGIAEAIATAPRFSRLRRLNFFALKTQDIQSLEESTTLKNLISLELSSSREMKAPAYQSFATNPVFSHLRFLDLSGCPVPAKSQEVLIDSPHISWLVLSWDKMREEVREKYHRKINLRGARPPLDNYSEGPPSRGLDSHF